MLSPRPRGNRSRVSQLIESQSSDLNQVQAKTLTGWVNFQLQQGGLDPIADLSADLMDGVLLAKLLYILTKEEVKKIRPNASLRIQMIENCNLDLKFMKIKQVPFFNVSAEDIVDGNMKMILGLIWALACCFTIRVGMKEGEGDAAVPASDDKIKKMLIEFLYEVTDIRVNNLNIDLMDGMVLGTMVKNVIHADTGADITLDLTTPQSTLESAFTSADHHLKIPQLLEASDLVEGRVDEKSMMLFLSLFQNVWRNKKEQQPPAPLGIDTQMEEELERALSLEREAFLEKLRIAEEEKETIRLSLEALEAQRLKEKEEVELELKALLEAEKLHSLAREDLELQAELERKRLQEEAENAREQMDDMELVAKREREERERIEREREHLQRMVEQQKLELEKANEKAEQQRREYQQMLDKQKADQDALRQTSLSIAEKEQTALKILEELKRAEQEKLANTVKIPTTNRSAHSLQNQPTGGEWEGSIYVCKHTSTTTPGTQTETVSQGFAGLMSKTKDFGSRLTKEMKHSFYEGTIENDHETVTRFNSRFKFEKEEPFYLEFSCKFTASGSIMMIGFGYITRNFLCLSGGNARDLISIIIPLVDIKNISMGSTAIFTSYSAVPKITAVTNPSKANAVLVFDIYDHVHNIFSVNNPNTVIQILNLRVEECKKNSAVPENLVAAETATSQVANSSWAAPRVINTITTPDRVGSVDSAETVRKPTRAPAPLPPTAIDSSQAHVSDTVPRVGSVDSELSRSGSVDYATHVETPTPTPVAPSQSSPTERFPVPQRPSGAKPQPVPPNPTPNPVDHVIATPEKRDSADPLASRFSERNPFARARNSNVQQAPAEQPPNSG